jgi:predicted MFS family arabinose efflux permease
LLPAVAADLGVAADGAGLFVAVSQTGYLIGLVAFLPLGDVTDRRRLAPALFAATGLGLLGAAAAPGAAWLALALLCVGATAAVTQVLITVAADRAEPAQRGRTIGTVASGAVLGVLLSRTASGAIEELAGWRAVYLLAGTLVLATAVLLQRRLPAMPPRPGATWGGQLRMAVALVRDVPVLRSACVLGALTFAAFSVLWSSLALMLSGPPYGFGEGVIGLFGLAAAGGVLGARSAGAVHDRGHGRALRRAALALGALSFGALVFGRSALLAVVLGIVLVDLAIQTVQITNQSSIFTTPHPRGALTTAYMTSRFLGGAAGSGLGAVVFPAFGWQGVAVTGIVLFLLPLGWDLLRPTAP